LSQQILQEESRRLQRVISVIDNELDSIREELSHQNAMLREIRKEEFMEGLRSLTFEDQIDISRGLARIASVETRQQGLMERASLLEKMRSSPYFARIDFRRSGSDRVIKVYLGIASLIDPVTKEHLVFDWRAPISSMYYDYGLGPASYKAVRDEIKGEIILKRQYKIDKGTLLRVFDTDLAITDELLQEVLSSAPGDKMRTIVNTIQREQNTIIRDDVHKVLVVQGAAGSGKTSVALHRVAYLLYKYRGHLKADDIVIFSPNRIFSDYISDVLPELGEAQVGMATFRDLARVLSNFDHIQTYSSHIDALLTINSPTTLLRRKGSQFKSTDEFLHLIKSKIRHFEENCPFNEDVMNGEKVVVSKQEFRDMYYSFYSYLPPFSRVKKILSRVNWLLRPLEKARAKELEEEMNKDPNHAMDLPIDIREMAASKARNEFDEIRNQVQNCTFLSSLEVYRELMRDLSKKGLGDVGKDTLEALEMGFLPYEDAAPYSLLKCLLEGTPTRENVKHVIVDEGQDYSRIQYELLRMLYPNARFTILGDLNQTVNPYLNLGDYQVLSEIFGHDDTFIVTLTKSYRSTLPILEFTNAILETQVAKSAVHREGPLPFIHILQDKESWLKALERELSDSKSSIGIVCKNARQAMLVFEDLKRLNLSTHLVTREDQRFSRGLIVLPIYLAKGLEFERVVIPWAGPEDYSSREERRLLYTACTRALHRLDILAVKRLSPFVEAVDPSLYTLVK
jgi:DNA helicase-2/ATP-dependent DNA helicase PcrA